jgi:A/G-specific adenine glycosylase
MDFSRQITDWYRQNKRELPWRQTTNPYYIWLSEIILQQTRVIQGMNYYLKFINHYPTIDDLANADEQSVLNDWQGLGYYSRARNLHAAAKQIQSTYNGVFPKTYEEIISLKGVGNYTAAAISSFAYNLPYAVVDGNVFRLLSRLFDIDIAIDSNEGQKTFAQIANELLDKENPSLHNQAIMEFGALQCTPAPDCSVCPLRVSCAAFSASRVAELPIKSKKTKVKEIEMNYLIIEQNGQILVRERTGNGIWKGLWEFYLIEDQADWLPFSRQALKSPPVHLLSHRKINCQAWHVQVPDNFKLVFPEGYVWMSPSEFESKGKSVLLLNLITDNLDCPILQDISPAYL